MHPEVSCCCGNCIFFHRLEEEQNKIDALKGALTQYMNERSNQEGDTTRNDSLIMQMRMKTYHLIRGERYCKLPPSLAYSTTDCTNLPWFMERSLFNF